MFINQILTKLKSLVYSKSETDSLLNSKASSSHTHTKSQITDFPTIPTVNNATLKIQKNGTDVKTFTANASTDVTCNITVPTNNNELTNGAGYITTNGAAYPRRVDGVTMNFNWSGKGGQPTWLWGGEDGTNMYVYNPSNFSVNYANSAGSVAWSNVSDRPTALSQFTNNSGFITSEIDSSGTGWVRFKSGVQICYGCVNNINNLATGITRFSFPKAFGATPNVIVTPNISARYVVTASVESTLTWVLNTYGAYSSSIDYVVDLLAVNYIAIGKWK